MAEMVGLNRIRDTPPERTRPEARNHSVHGDAPGARSARPRLTHPLYRGPIQKEVPMEPRQRSRVRLGIEELEYRATPAGLTPVEVPGLDAAFDHHAQVRHVGQAATPSHARPFHLDELGTAVINPNGTVTGRATAKATH